MSYGYGVFPDAESRAWREKLQYLTRTTPAERRALRGDPTPPRPPGGQVRYGLLCPGLEEGGASVWQLAMARYLDRSRVECAGCCYLQPGSATPGMLEATRALMPVTSGPLGALELAERCDVLISWAVEGIDNLTSGLAPRPSVVAVAHSPAESRWAVEHYGRLSGVDRWVAVSESARRAIPGPARDAAALVPNCVDSARLRPARDSAAVRASWGVPPGSLVCGFYGRIAPEKRADHMIAIARALPRPWHVVIVGPDYMPGLRERSRDLGNVHWAGPDPAAGDVLRAFDVLCVPSDFESWCLTMAEGIEVGTPVVSTPVGIAAEIPGIARIVRHGAGGRAWSREVEAAVWEGRPAGQLATIAGARQSWNPAAFGRAWTDLICEAARRS